MLGLVWAPVLVWAREPGLEWAPGSAAAREPEWAPGLARGQALRPLFLRLRRPQDGAAAFARW